MKKTVTPKPAWWLAAALAVVCVPGSSGQGSDVSGGYFAFSGGPQWRAKATDSAGQTTFKAGFAGNAAIGYRLHLHRVEAEYSFFNNRCKTTDPAGPAIGKEPSSGDVDVDAIMANYAIALLPPDRRIAPYLGVGLGTYRVSINGLTTPSLRTLPPAWGGPVIVYARSSWTTAYQARCGLKLRLRPQTDFVLGYRFFEGSELDINLADGSTIHPKARVHGAELGMHLRF